MNGMIFRSFRKRNSSQKNTNTVYSEYSYSGIVPKERTLTVFVKDVKSVVYIPLWPFIFINRSVESVATRLTFIILFNF